jgi:hypothetical protein
MRIARSTYYDRPEKPADDTAIVEAIAAICDEFEHYGWRRVQAALRQQGLTVNHKKIRRLMREHGLQPRFASPLHGDNRQRSRPADLLESRHRYHPHRTRPTLGSRYHVRCHLQRLCLCRRYPRCLVAASSRIRHQPLDRRTADAGGPSRRDRESQTATRLRASFRSRVAIRRGSLSRSSCRPRPSRFHGPARQPLRQRQGGKLHEDAQGRSRLSDGIRNLQRRCRKHSTLP